MECQVMNEKRNFTDADISALVAKMKQEFFTNLGSGIWSFVWKGILMGLIMLSLYGAGKHWWDV